MVAPVAPECGEWESDMRDVGEWLRSLGLGQYADLFSRNAIDAAVLADLTDGDLRELDIPIGHRKRILRAIRQLGRGTAAPSYTPQRSERRLLTILFVDIVGSTALAEQLDPEDVADVFNAFHETSGRVVERLGGFVARNLGDGLAAYFGWPESREHDAERAVRTGLELIEAVKKIPTGTADPLRLHIAAATGHVVVSDVLRLDSEPVQEVFGALPNLAARLQSLSPPDTILISEETLRLINQQFVCVDFGKRKLRGFQEPVSISRVVGLRALSLNFEARRESGLVPLVGRTAEKHLMTGCWKQASAGHGQILLLSGEPGIGKSRLCAELLGSISEESVACLNFQCSPLHTDTPLHPVARSIARVAGLSDQDTAEVKERKLKHLFRNFDGDRAASISVLGTYVGVADTVGSVLRLGSPERQRMALHQLLCDFVLMLARERPVLITFEDIHWADPTTSEFLDSLVARAAGGPILLAVTCRTGVAPSWQHSENCTTLNLNRLSRDESAQLVEASARRESLPRDVVSEIAERSDGNPLFVEELTAAVLGRRQGAKANMARVEAPQPHDIPATLQESLLARIDKVSPHARELIQTCAVLGRRFSHQQIAAMADPAGARLEESLADLVRNGLLLPAEKSASDEYAFKHALIQDAAYSTILREKRQRLHAKCAATLERCFPSVCAADPRSLAMHHELAGNAAAAIPYFIAATHVAIERAALREAEAIIQNALGLLGDLPEAEGGGRNELQLRSLLGRVRIFSKGWADLSVKSEYVRALELTEALGLEKEQVPLEWALTTHHLLRGEIREAITGGQRVLDLAGQDNDQDLLHVAHSALTIYQFYGGNFLGSIEHADATLSCYRPEATEELRKNFGTDRRLQALRAASLAHWCLGDHRKSLALDEEQRVRAVGAYEYAYALTISCILHALRRDTARIEAFATEAIEIGRDLGFRFLESNARNFHAIAAALREPGESTLALCDEAIDAYQQAGNRMGVSSMHAVMAELCGRVGLHERGVRYVDKALAYVGRSGERFALADLYRIKGELLAAGKHAEDAERWLERAVRLAEKQHAKSWSLPASVALARLMFDKSRTERALELLRPWQHGSAELRPLFEALLEQHGISIHWLESDGPAGFAEGRDDPADAKLVSIRARRTPAERK
jgi:class 3 adenylate cyclase/tetratricopeptide (TPR) repeat protein